MDELSMESSMGLRISKHPVAKHKNINAGHDSARQLLAHQRVENDYGQENDFGQEW